MDNSYQMQRLFQENAPYPYSWREIISSAPCKQSRNDCGYPDEAAITSFELKSMSALLNNKENEAQGILSQMPSALEYHIHNHSQLTQCVSGKILYIIGKATVLLSGGDLLLINEMIPHSWIIPEPPTTRYQLGFYPHSFDANAYCHCLLPFISRIFDQRRPYILITPAFSGYDSIRFLVEQIGVVHAKHPVGFDGIIHNLIFDLFTQLCLSEGLLIDTHASYIGTIDKTLKYIDQNIAGDLSLRSLAKHVNMDPSYFSAYFKKHMGIGYKRFVTQKRLVHAVNLLQDPENSITHVMFECGFSSVSAFYNAFSEIYAVSPAQYRKMQPIAMLNTQTF